ncbi:uncharacterized protein lrriq1 [Tautogolabrus adspersus]
MRELNNDVVCDTDETTEKLESFSMNEETDLEDIPLSLLSYFESSKSRAVACEKLILEEPGDFFVSHHTEDKINLSSELHEDMMKHDEQVVCDPEIDENSSSTDMRLLHAPTETEELLPHNVSVCPNNEGEAGADIDKEGEKHSVFEERTLEISLDDEENLKGSGYEAEREKLCCEEVKKEEQRRQIENDFQRELKKIMEAEKLHQKELELMEKKAQEKLEQELLLQQEVINSLQRRVKEERRRMEEEQKRLKVEEDKKRRAEETIKIEAEMRRMEGERRRKEEEERQIEEMRLIEEERKNEEEEKRRMEREEERLLTLEKKKLADEMRLMEEEERKKREDLGRIKRKEKGKMEEDRKNIEEARKMENIKNKDKVILEKEDRNKMQREHLKIGKEKQIIEEKRKLKEVRKREEEESETEAERKRMGEERRKMIEEEKILRKEEEERRNQEEERRRMEREEEEKREKERSKMALKLEAELRIMKEEEEKQKKEELEKIKREKEENERTKAEQDNKNQNDEIEMILKKEEEERKYTAQDKMNQAKRTWGTEENGNQEAEVKAGGRKQREEEEREQTRETKMEWKQMEEKKEEQRRRQGYREDYKEEEKYRFKGYDGDQRKVENENKTKDKESMREEGKEKNILKVEKEQIGEVVWENRTHVYKETGKEVRLREEEKHLRVMEEEKEVKVAEENELQEKGKEKEHHSATSLDEKMNKDIPESSFVSNTWTSSSPGPSHRESTISPISTESETQQNDLDNATSQTSTDKKVDDKNQAERPSSVSPFIPVFLPEHTEQKRLSWMKECVPWSKLSLQNKRKQKGSFRSVRGLRRAVKASSLPPLCKSTLLQTTGWTSLREVTTVTLEDLPGCSLSTLSQCTQLQSLTLRRCGLKSLESINQLSKLCYIDVQENDISFVDCENMTSLRVLKLGHNKLTSIHGLTGAESLDVLELSHNSITRIAGLESLRRLQRLSLDHNQLISTKGLKEVYTLLHLSCSHNHLVRAEGLENSALLNTLDLRTNSLTEPPSLNNHVLLRELHLDDNSISSLQDLSTCWLPLIQHLSVAQNRITQLPSMSDFVSLANLDLRFNCLSELQNLCESLQGCHILRALRLTGNPLQQESGWRPTLQKALPGLRAFDDQETDSFPSPPAVQQVSLASGSFLAFCQAQLQQTRDVQQQQHSSELRGGEQSATRQSTADCEVRNHGQKNKLPAEVTVEDLTDLLLMESKKSLRVQLWDFELEDFDDVDIRSLLKLVWEVNTSFQMRDVEFEARRLLDSPEKMPSSFQHPTIISQAHEYCRILEEQRHEVPIPKQLGPQGVVIDVVPKVLQDLWVPPRTTSREMPSQQLSKMAVGVTKAVLDRVSTALSTKLQEVSFSRSIRDDMVLSVTGKVRQMYSPDILKKKKNCFEAELLNTITDVAVWHICGLKASSPLDALKTSCRHFTEALQLAEDQRFAHEYGDTTVSDRHKAAGPTTPEETTDMGCISIEKHTEQTEMEATDKAPAVIPNRDNIRCSYWTLEEKSAEKIQHDTSDSVPAGLKMGLNASIANSDSEYTVATKSKSSSSSDFEVAPVSNHQDLELQSKAAVVIQQMWRKYRQKCGYISSPSTAGKREGRGRGGGRNRRKPQSGPSVINRGINGQDYAATIIQAVWRGFTLRRRLTSALAAITCTDTGEDDTFEEVDMDEFVFDEAALEKHWTTLCEEPPPRCYNESEQQLSLKVFQPPGTFPEASQYILPPPLVWRSKQAWVDEEQVVSAEQRVSPVSSTRSKSPASTPVLSGLTERSEKILEEWGFTHSHTALLMLKRAQKMKSKKQQQKKNPSAHLTLFRNCSYQMDPVGAPNRRAKHNRNYKKVVESELGLQQAEETERVKQERAQQWLHSQAVHSDRDSESIPFLPEISTDLLHGGRVQLVADLGYTERQHHASGLWANSSVAAQPCKENSYPRRNSQGHARKELQSPKRVSSAPSKKERMSFRDNPVQLSGGWGGGKKRDRVFK